MTNEEQLKLAREWYNDLATTKREKIFLEELFPELKESEDEKIRKDIVAAVETHGDFTQGRKEEIYAWLEKQDDYKPTRPVWKYKKDCTPLLRDSFILNKYGCLAKSPSGALVSDVWVLDFDELAKLPKEEFEKQGEKGDEQ